MKRRRLLELWASILIAALWSAPALSQSASEPVWGLFASAVGKAFTDEDFGPCDVTYTVAWMENEKVLANVEAGTMVTVLSDVTRNEAQAGLKAYGKYFDDGADGVVKFGPCFGGEEETEEEESGGPGGANGPPSTLDLSGAWTCTRKCPAGGEGKTARIAQNGDSLRFTNEGGDTSDGRFEGRTTVVALGWGGLKGTVRDRGGSIHWANGTIWVRSKNGAPVDLSGAWTCTRKCPAGGKGKTARIAQSGDSLRFTNEGGDTSEGRFEGRNTVVALGWGGLKGTIRDHGTSIHWANGTIWMRR